MQQSHSNVVICYARLDPALQEVSARLGAEFSRLVEAQVTAAPFIPGALQAIQDLHAHGLLCFVVSGTPQDELRRICDQRDLTRLFGGHVYGSPALKPDIVRRLVAGARLVPNDGMMVRRAWPGPRPLPVHRRRDHGLRGGARDGAGRARGVGDDLMIGARRCSFSASCCPVMQARSRPRPPHAPTSTPAWPRSLRCEGCRVRGSTWYV